MRYGLALCPTDKDLMNYGLTTRVRPLDVLAPKKSHAKPGVKMEVTVHIPDTIGARLENDPEAIPRWLLEKAGLEAYRSGEISGYELRLMLGIKSRLELDAFLKKQGVYLEYTEEDFAHDAETSRQLKLKQA